MEKLNKDQRQVIRAIFAGENIFLTGPGGTGKSFLIGTLLDVAPKEMKIAVTALTGCAALLLGASGRGVAKTLHSWAGIGLGKEDVPTLVKRIRANRYSAKNWHKTDLLIVDEVSMMTADLLEKLDAIGKAIRGNSAPFGGIQLLFVGDFFQLPPVVRNMSPEEEEAGHYFAFASDIWARTFTTTIHLEKIVRQTDTTFHTLLTAARRGELSDADMALLQARMGLDWQTEAIRPTLLFSRKADVDTINDANMKALGGESYTYLTKMSPMPDATAAEKTQLGTEEVKRAADYMDHEASYMLELKLAVGSQVMLLHNMDIERALVNGSRGVVVRFVATAADGEKLPVVRFKTGVEEIINYKLWPIEGFKGIARMQIPLRLAWAVTIHKSQGATLDCCLIDIGKTTFTYGQAYVALSRVKSMDSLYVWQLDKKAFKAHPRVVEFYRQLGREKATAAAAAAIPQPIMQIVQVA